MNTLSIITTACNTVTKLTRPTCSPGFTHVGRNCSHLRESLGGFEKLFRKGVFEEILGNQPPAHRAGRIDQELSRTRNVFAAGHLFGMDQIVATDSLELWIREKSKTVASRLHHVFAGVFGRIDADAHHPDASLDKLVQILFDTPQLGVTVRSPVASVKN